MKQRFMLLLYWQLQAHLPRPGGIHIYSKGAMISGFTADTSTYEMTISNDIDYGGFALGLGDDNTRLTPRGPLETINFKTLDRCILNVSRIFADFFDYNGGIYVNGIKLN